jgi:multiple sugar transport system ATP-binding protein
LIQGGEHEVSGGGRNPKRRFTTGLIERRNDSPGFYAFGPAILQIEPLLARRPAELSGGQRQLVAIGRALVRKPAVFLFDEPLSNLDAKLRMEMRGELRRLHELLGATVVYVTHDQIEAMTLGTRIAVMNHGRIEQIGAPSEIYDRPANLYVSGFVGSPAMNVLTATLHRGATALTAKLAKSGQTIQLSADHVKGIVPDGANVMLGIRPEAVHLAAETDPRAIRANIVDVELTGADKLVFARIDDAEFTGRLDPHVEIASGEVRSFVFDTAGVSLFEPENGNRL